MRQKCHRLDALALGLHDDVHIVKIPRPGIEHAPPQDGFHFFSQDGLDVVSPDLYPLIRKK